MSRRACVPLAQPCQFNPTQAQPSPPCPVRIIVHPRCSLIYCAGELIHVSLFALLGVAGGVLVLGG